MLMLIVEVRLNSHAELFRVIFVGTQHVVRDASAVHHACADVALGRLRVKLRLNVQLTVRCLPCFYVLDHGSTRLNMIRRLLDVLLACCSHAGLRVTARGVIRVPLLPVDAHI